MTEEVRDRCLEPFFSTKGESGTGLGLSMVFGVVKRHGATLDIESTPGTGTTVCIHFPRCDEEDAAAAEECSLLERSLRVLVVDDEPVSRDVVTKYLEMDGHSVLTVTNGREAMGKVMFERFDLLLTDHAMPEMNGVQLACAAKGVQPDLPVILLTGFDAVARQNAEKPVEVDFILHKPIPRNILRRALREAILPSGGVLSAIPALAH
jgi:CheY-like chemotaxis protein